MWITSLLSRGPVEFPPVLGNFIPLLLQSRKPCPGLVESVWHVPAEVNGAKQPAECEPTAMEPKRGCINV